MNKRLSLELCGDKCPDYIERLTEKLECLTGTDDLETRVGQNERGRCFVEWYNGGDPLCCSEEHATELIKGLECVCLCPEVCQSPNDIKHINCNDSVASLLCDQKIDEIMYHNRGRFRDYNIEYTLDWWNELLSIGANFNELNYYTNLKYTQAIKVRKALSSMNVASICTADFCDTWSVLYVGSPINIGCLKLSSLDLYNLNDRDLVCGWTTSGSYLGFL